MILFWKSKKFWRWAIVLLLIFGLHFSGLLRPLENYLFLSIRPLSVLSHQAGVWLQGETEAGLSLDELSSKLAATENKLARVTIDQAKLDLLVEENDKLRSQLNFLNNNEYRTLNANIIARQNLFNTTLNAQDIIIDKGSQEGLSVGLGVINEAGIIIGKIVEVKDYSARVCLTTSADCQLAVAIMNEAKTIGLSEGELGLTIHINYIPQLEAINLDDIVITSGLGGSIPRGLVIGRVSQVNNQSNEIWQDVSIEPLASLRSLTVVSVVLP